MVEISEPPTRVDVLLQIWADWMRQGGSVSRWYPTNAAGMEGSGNTLTEDFYRGIDVTAAAIMDAIINDLTESLRAAIRHEYLGDKYAGYIVTYWHLVTEAKDIIKKKADEKGIY